MKQVSKTNFLALSLLFAVAPFSSTQLFAQKKKIAAVKTYDAQNRTSKIYTTADKSDLRLSETGTLVFKPLKQPVETQICIFVDPDKKFQSFIGIGGAITDATAETFAKLPKESQQQFLRAYYDRDKGIGYTLARTTIHSSDFSSGSYTYVKDNDPKLTTFNVAHDEQYRIPLIKQAIQAAGGKLPMFVSPWSPPAFMKTNNEMLHGGKLRPEFRQAWADYYVKFIKTYEKMGMPIWGLSVQNEPMATQKWESCVYTAEEERDFVKQYLGPTLQKQGLASKKLIVWDHNRDLIYQRASIMLNDPEAAKYVWGVGFHWYETWTGSAQQFENVKMVHEAYPKVNLMLTEACVEKFDMARINDWALGERYGLSLINDFNSGATAWTDWNMLLDENGGPNHVGNFCFAPIHGDTRTGRLIYTNSYYYLGQFSKFVRPGAKRIAAVSNRDKLITTAFQNTDGQVVVVVMNKSDDKVSHYVWIAGKAAEATALPHSISTFVIN